MQILGAAADRVGAEMTADSITDNHLRHSLSASSVVGQAIGAGGLSYQICSLLVQMVS